MDGVHALHDRGTTVEMT